MLVLEIPRDEDEVDRVPVPREVEARGAEALEQFYFAQCELRREKREEA